MTTWPKSVPLPDDYVPPEFPEAPATPRDAATVVLVRDAGGSGVEVFLQRRVAGMAFAGGMTVFPGGGLDQRDIDTAVAWYGPDASAWADWFDCEPSLARGLVCAAVRETFEESGVLLAGDADGVIVTDSSPYHYAREALISRELSLAAFLDDAKLVLCADLLRPWASWVTPAQEPRRYDARFFVAALPEGQRADDATTETESSSWKRPADALAEADAGKLPMLPPTRVTLAELAEYDSVASALAAQREIPRIEPTIVRGGSGVRFDFPPPRGE